MEIFQAIVLGLVQGLTEFLPISSSAHLVLLPYFFNWPDPGLGFDVALHWGTLLAVIFIFRKDYAQYFRGFLSSLFVVGRIRFFSTPATHKFTLEQKMAWFLIFGSIPAAIIGFIFQKQAETAFRIPLVTVLTLAGFAYLLWLVDRYAKKTDSESSLNWKKVLFIGLAQALSIIPGVSRSGVTMTVGMLTKLDRKTAARFSFLLSGPIIFGAGLVSIFGMDSLSLEIIVGFFASALSGAIAIKFLLRYLISHNFSLFVWYRYALSILILLLIFIR